MRRKFLPGRETEDHNLHMIVVVEGAAENAVFRDLHLGLQVGIEHVAHASIVRPRAMRSVRLAAIVHTANAHRTGNIEIEDDPPFPHLKPIQAGAVGECLDVTLASLAITGNGSVNAIANSLSGPAPGVSGTGLLAQVQFLALAPSSGSFVSPFDTILLDFDINQLSGVTETGTQVTVTSPQVSPVPEPASFALLGLIMMTFVAGRHFVRRGLQHPPR